LFKIANNKINKQGCLILESQTFRTQAANKKDLLRKFVGLLMQASIKPKKRLPTKPSKQSVEKRLDMKNKRSRLKQTRRKPQW
jgi:ribosome-associated protein